MPERDVAGVQQRLHDCIIDGYTYGSQMREDWKLLTEEIAALRAENERLRRVSAIEGEVIGEYLARLPEAPDA